jgi:two-component system, NarL family, response regulator DevR
VQRDRDVRVASRIRILIADDHEIMRQGIRSALEHEPDMTIVGDAETGRQAIILAREQQPDVALLDVKLGDIDGAEACARILQVSPRTIVVMLTNYSQDNLVFQSLAAGAKGYVLKDVGLAELRRTIRAAFHGGSILDPRIAAQVISKAVQRRATMSSDGVAKGPGGLFSAAELATIQHLASGLTNKQIGDRLHLSAHTIKDRLEKIAVTLGVRSRTEIVAEAFRRGLI